MVGRPTYFLRVYGCNLDCWFCDQPSALTSAEARGVKSIVQDTDAEEEAEQAAAYPPSVDLCFTGGEPSTQHGEIITVMNRIYYLDELASLGRLHQAPRRMTMETNGTIFVPAFAEGPNSFLSCSPKFTPVMIDSKSGAYGEPALREWVNSGVPMQFKFVVLDQASFDGIWKWVCDFVKTPEQRARIALYFQPEWFKGREAFKSVIKSVLQDRWEAISAEGFKEFRFLPQTHKILALR